MAFNIDEVREIAEQRVTNLSLREFWGAQERILAAAKSGHFEFRLEKSEWVNLNEILPLLSSLGFHIQQTQGESFCTVSWSSGDENGNNGNNGNNV